MFSGCTVPPHTKETKHESSNQEASPSVGKNTGIVLMLYRTWKCFPKAIFDGVCISEVPGCHVTTDELSVRSQKLFQRLVSQELTSYLRVNHTTL